MTHVRTPEPATGARVRGPGWSGRRRRTRGAHRPRRPGAAKRTAQESGFRPDAYADDSNGGTWGLFQINADIWQATYGHPWSADLDGNGVWDVKDGAAHARVGGEYLCGRLAGVREIRARHPDWASSQIPVLDALIIAHNAGESRLRTYPNIPNVTRDFIQNVDQHVAEWSTVTDAGLLSDLPDDGSSPGPSNAPTPELSGPLTPRASGAYPASADRATSSSHPAHPTTSPQPSRPRSPT